MPAPIATAIARLGWPGLTLVVIAALALAIADAPAAFAADTATDSAQHDGHDHGYDGDAKAEKEVSPLGVFDFHAMPYIWNTLMFLVLLGILMYYVWPAVLKGLREREDKIRADIEAAKTARKDAESMKADFEKQLAEARAESAKTVAEARAAADQLAVELKANAEAEITGMKQRAQAEINSAKEAALADLYTQTAALATDVAGKILGRSLNADDQRDLVEQTIQQYQQN
ncbi:MAG: F0F1 ATP synthase subunit B [Planctomycetota bacterium]